MRLNGFLGYGLLATIAVALDQWIKLAVQAHMEMYERIDLLPFLALFRTTNTGVAFSMLSWIHDRGLVVLSLLVVAFVLYLAVRSQPGQILARIGFALIIGGAVGNVIDRVSYGHVVDYILFHTPAWSFAVFNLADAFISVGAALIVLEELLAWLRERRGRAASDD